MDPTRALREAPSRSDVGRGFDGGLPWGCVDNRPLLRCCVGAGLCAWRLGRAREAAALFEKILWCNPLDHQGARFLLASVEAGRPWRRDEA